MIYRFGIENKQSFRVDPRAATVVAIHPQLNHQQLVSNKIVLEFKTTRNTLKLAFALTSAVVYAYAVTLLYFLRRFVNSLSIAQPFTNKNVLNLRILGTMLVFVEPISALIQLSLESILDNYFSHTLFSLGSGIEKVGFWLGYGMASASFVSSWKVAGLIVLVLGEVFKQGIVLKEEQDLTI